MLAPYHASKWALEGMVEALRYEVRDIRGEDHARDYTVAVFLNDRALGSGRGSSKKQAEEAAAREALRILQQE